MSPRVIPKRPKVDPEALYVAWDTAYIGPVDQVIRAGTRLRGDHPAVKTAPWLFMPAETPDDVVAARQAEEHARIMGDTAPSRDSENQSVRVTEREIPESEAMVSIGDAWVTAAASLGGGGPLHTLGGGPVADTQGRPLSAPYGTRVAEDHPIVEAMPNLFVRVNPLGLPPERAMVAKERVSTVDENGNERVIHAGQWASPDDPLVLANPHVFERPR